ncbi:MAG: hypothetical protein D6803_05540 [Anaerolineae bacterium]|nr:MAG: hypothetical protein D6803_05540 [Anaerolineae bacterium]
MLRPRAQRALQRAHRLMENGEYANAADLFVMLAQGAQDLGRTPQAARLFLQGGKACLLAGQRQRGRDLLHRGLDLLAQAGMWAKVHQAGERIVTELEGWGETEMADEFRQYLEKNLPESAEVYRQRAKQQPARPSLPLHCPSCGGPVRPDEVEWLDDNTAECPYCGSGLRGE